MIKDRTIEVWKKSKYKQFVMLLRVCKLFVRLRRGVDTSSVTLFHRWRWHGASWLSTVHGTIEKMEWNTMVPVTTGSDWFFRGSRQTMCCFADHAKQCFFRGIRERTRERMPYCFASRERIDMTGTQRIVPRASQSRSVLRAQVRTSPVSGPSRSK